MSAKIRQEINIQTQSLAVSNAASNSNQIVQIDTTQYDNPTFYFETVAKNVGASGNATITLRRNGTSTDDATNTYSTSDTSETRKRSTSFSPPAGQTEYIFRGTPNGGTFTVDAVRIIVIDSSSSPTKSETQIEIAGTGGSTYTSTTAIAMTAPKYWTYTAARWDGTKTFDAEVVWRTASTNTATITLQEDNGSFASWANIITIVNAASSTTPTRTRTTAHFIPTDGRHYRIAVLSSTTKSTVTIYCAKVVVNQSSNPTKLEPQYLLLNTPDDNTTNQQNYFTLWDDTEWDDDAGSTTFYHAMDSDNASNSADLIDEDNSDTQVTNSSVTGANQQISSALTMPTTGHQIDTDIDNTTGVVAASRILVQYVYVASGGGGTVVKDIIGGSGFIPFAR